MPDLDQLQVGDRASMARTVTEADVVLFAGVTGDANPVHLNEAWARSTRFGGRIAHGMLTAGYISAVLGTRLPGPGVIYLEQTLRFRKPVRIGDTITATVEVADINREKRRVRLATICTNEEGVEVLTGEALVLVPGEDS